MDSSQTQDAQDEALTAPTVKQRIDSAMERLEGFLELGGVAKDVTLLVISAISLIVSFLAPDILPFNPAWIAIVLCGLPIILEAIIGLVTVFDIKADVLVSLALIAAVIIGEDFAAGEVALIMQLGGLLEDLTVAKARAGIERLVNLSPRTARIVDPTDPRKESIVSADQVAVGDIVRVLPGETIPVDGVIVKGTTTIDESLMTGEPLPVDKSEGDEVRSGTVNQFGAFSLRASRVGEDSSLARMIALVQSADASKAKIVRLTDRWATWIVVIALISAAGTWLVTDEIIRAVTILVVFCPCALVLATPTAIMAAIGNVSKCGILVREGDALERLAMVKKLGFDKTGTLTFGVPQVVGMSLCKASGHKDHAGCCGEHNTQNNEITTPFSTEELYYLLASCERLSEHPLGKAIVQSWQREHPDSKPLAEASDFKMIPGRGISARLEDKELLAGNFDMMLEAAVVGALGMQDKADVYLAEGYSVIYVAINKQAAGVVALADTIRSSAAETIAGIKAQGVEPVLLTGDNARAAKNIADQVGIENVKAPCLPQDKMRIIEEYENEKKPIAMVGDGINDAPALKRATVGIAMGSTGSDIAVDAADIALIGDDISSLPHLLALSRRMMTTIKLNLTFSLALNFIAIILAMTGILNPVAGALVHNAGSVIVIVNSATLLAWHHRTKK